MNYRKELDENMLQHFGILGMRWGRKKGAPGTKRLRRKEQLKKDNEDQNKKIKSMSDDEIRKKINRIQMERQYAELTATKLQKGNATAVKIVNAAATTAVTGYLVNRFSKFIKEQFG